VEAEAACPFCPRDAECPAAAAPSAFSLMFSRRYEKFCCRLRRPPRFFTLRRSSFLRAALENDAAASRASLRHAAMVAFQPAPRLPLPPRLRHASFEDLAPRESACSFMP